MAVSFTGVARLTVVEATDLHAPDVAGTKSIDPYCIVSIDDGAVARTTHKSKTFNPRWAEVGVFFFFCFFAVCRRNTPHLHTSLLNPISPNETESYAPVSWGVPLFFGLHWVVSSEFWFLPRNLRCCFFFFLHQPAFLGALISLSLTFSGL
jgi:hypothetical protein